MTIAEWLRESIKKLDRSSISTSRLDAEVLLSDILNKDRSWLIAHTDFLLQGPILVVLDEQVSRRAKHEPLAYIRGKQEFYGRDFEVSPATLTPRPETETLVELALDILKNNKIDSVSDIGSGSGCIIITLSLESARKFKAVGYEISKEAISIAAQNANNLRASVEFVHADIKENNEQGWQQAEMLVANLPYVPEHFQINLAASHEPRQAIFGGEDGLDYYRILFEKLGQKTRFVLTESLPPQHPDLTTIAEKAGFKMTTELDFIQVFERVK